MAGRFIKLYDKILNWEWYRDGNTLRLFIHILLRANYKDLNFQGRVIKRGQMATSLSALALETGMSERQIRVSLDRLKMSGELSSLSCPRYRIITVIKYDDYQSDGRQDVTLMTSRMSASRQAECHPHDKQNVSLPVTKYRNIENIEQIEQIDSPTERERTAKRFLPPSPGEVDAFCQENGLRIDAERFCDYYASKGWKVGNAPMKDWRAAARNWAKRESQPAQKPTPEPKRELNAYKFEQRDYSGVPDDDMRSLEAEMRRFKETGEVDM